MSSGLAEHGWGTRSRWRGVVAGLLLLTLGSCYTLARTRWPLKVETDGATAVLGVWVEDRGPILSDPPNPAYDVIICLVAYPMDVYASTMYAVQAPFREDMAIRWGPLGAVAGIVLPFVTLMPGLFVTTPQPVTLSRSEFDSLMAKIRAGDGVAAYREILAPHTHVAGEVFSVAIDEVTPTPGTRAPTPQRDRLPRALPTGR